MNGYEESHIHPATMKWLVENGYEYAYEFLLPNQHRIDFVARHTSTGDVMVVECKSTPVQITRDIQQINDNHKVLGYPSAKKLMVYPRNSLSNTRRAKIESHGIEIIEVDPLWLITMLEESPQSARGFVGRREAAQRIKGLMATRIPFTNDQWGRMLFD
jgi:hypothetical protein